MDNGEDTVRARVGVEATGKPFDAINYTDQALLSEHLNPMVNMGAILLCTLIHGTSYSQRLERLLELTRRLAEVETSIYRLADAIKKTQKRANALQNIVIPGLDGTIRFITDALEEKEREEFARLKVIKRVTTKQK